MNINVQLFFSFAEFRKTTDYLAQAGFMNSNQKNVRKMLQVNSSVNILSISWQYWFLEFGQHDCLIVYRDLKGKP